MADDKDGSWVDLSQPIFQNMPGAKVHGHVSLWVEKPNLSNRANVRITHFAMAAHLGTHMDAPAHFFPEGKRMGDFPTSKFTGPGVVLNLERSGPVTIDVEDFENAAVEIRNGDIVFIYTGYAEKVGVVDIHSIGHPYLSDAAAQWLVDRDVPIVGVDFFTPDLPGGFRPENFDWPVHQILLGNETLIVENLGVGLLRLLDKRVEILCVPLRLDDADAGPVVPLARIIDEQ